MDDLVTRRRRALYRAQHRGTKEMDIVLGRYASAHLESMAADDLTVFEELLAMPEPQIDLWVMKGAEVPEPALAALVAKIRTHSGF